MVFLIVQIRQEHRAIKITFEIGGVSEVTSWSNKVLCDFEIDSGVGHFIDDRTEDSWEAVWYFANSHVWAADWEKVVYWELGWTELCDVSSNKTALWKTHGVEPDIFKIGVSKHFGACFCCLCLEVFKDWTRSPWPNFNAFSIRTGAISDFFGEFGHAFVFTGVTEAVKNNSWNRSSRSSTQKECDNCLFNMHFWILII